MNYYLSNYLILSELLFILKLDFFKIIQKKMIKELKILNLSSSFFKEMINILDVEPEYIMVNDFKGCKDGPILFNLCYSDEINVLHIVFNNIECIF